MFVILGEAEQENKALVKFNFDQGSRLIFYFV